MPTVAELSAPYGNVLLAPQHGPGVCEICFNLTDGYERCYACAHGGHWARRGRLRSPTASAASSCTTCWSRTNGRRGLSQQHFTVQLAAVLWRFGSAHEQCISRVARRCRRSRSSRPSPPMTPTRDGEGPAAPARRASSSSPTRRRFRRLLVRSRTSACNRTGSTSTAIEPTAQLTDEPVLLIDDTWTTGANAQSAAAALKRAGAGPVAAVVIGRHLNRRWGSNDRQLNGLPQPVRLGPLRAM